MNWKQKNYKYKLMLFTFTLLLLSGCKDTTVDVATKGEPAKTGNTATETGNISPDGNTATEAGNISPARNAATDVGNTNFAGNAATEAETDSIVETEEPEPLPSGEYDFTLCFAGDISLDENAVTTKKLDANSGDITKCISPELIAQMRQADLMWLNNEFTYSTNGSAMEGKVYTFRADPSRVEVLEELGVDVVGLANNHVYDYGKQALLDTFATLEGAGIPYVGAGRSLEEAMQPYYAEIDGKTIAFVAASRAEKYKMTPQATETEPGILRCYDTELFLQEIAEAKEQADFVIALVHWGTEYSTELEEVQVTTGKEYLDAGADAIIGAHSHCLQGVEYCDGKPIFYSLGNYWFNEKTLDTMLVQLHFYGDDDEQNLEVQIVPALQANAATTILTDEEERREFFDRMERISIRIEITDEGIVEPVK